MQFGLFYGFDDTTSFDVLDDFGDVDVAGNASDGNDLYFGVNVM